MHNLFYLHTDQVVLKKVIDWELNTELRAKLKLKAMPTYEIHTFPIAGNFTAKVLLQLPPNLDRSGNTKYPLLVDVYGGPDSTSVCTQNFVFIVIFCNSCLSFFALFF